MLNEEYLKGGIEELEKELSDSLKNFAKSKTWDKVREIHELSESLMYLKAIEGYDSISTSIKIPSEEHKKSGEFSMLDAETWVRNMITELPDGSKIQGAHWTLEQTTLVAKQKGIVFTHIQPYHFWVTMNMVYSDYLETAIKNGIDTLDFYVDMAKAFLFDIDSIPPKEKLSAYYFDIVKPALMM